MKFSEIENLTSDEKEAIDKLRFRVKNNLPPEKQNDVIMFYRFLKARNFDLDKAETMLRKSLEWRRINRMDYILTEFTIPEVLQKYGPPSFIGYDKEACIVRYLPSGNLDDKGIYKSTTSKDVLKAMLQVMEQDIQLLEKKSEELGKPVYQWSYIYNLDKLTLAKATNRQTTEILLNIVQQYQDNYPERVKRLIVINAPIYFQLLFSILKTIMANELLNKFRIYGTEGWKEELLEMIDPDVLPAFLGGKRTDPDGNPLCQSFVYHGGLVPESYYTIKECTLSLVPGVNNLLVYPMSKTDVPFNVQENGNLIEWEYETKHGDIGFGLFYRKSFDEDSRIEEILPVQKLDSNGPETGIYKCETPGIYIIVFDNSYSWFKSKEVFYKIFVVKRNGERIPIVK